MALTADPPKIMLGFVVRQCTVALGHLPSPGELVDWANSQRDAHGRYHLFGKPITEDDARLILNHPGRLVSVRPGPRWGLAS